MSQTINIYIINWRKRFSFLVRKSSSDGMKSNLIHGHFLCVLPTNFCKHYKQLLLNYNFPSARASSFKCGCIKNENTSETNEVPSNRILTYFENCYFLVCFKFEHIQIRILLGLVVIASGTLIIFLHLLSNSSLCWVLRNFWVMECGKYWRRILSFVNFCKLYGFFTISCAA